MSSFSKSYSHFFSKNISIYAIFNGQIFNETLTNEIVIFEQLGPDYNIALLMATTVLLVLNGICQTTCIKRFVMLEAGMRQVQVARCLGVSQSVISCLLTSMKCCSQLFCFSFNSTPSCCTMTTRDPIGR